MTTAISVLVLSIIPLSVLTFFLSFFRFAPPSETDVSSLFLLFAMWTFASKVMNAAVGLKRESEKPPDQSLSDDNSGLLKGKDEGLDCPVCWESFNIFESAPHVLWCGHTLCRNCVIGLQRAVVRFPTLPITLPFFICCPWCNLLSLRLVFKGIVKFPCKNFYVLWMVESRNGNRSKSRSSTCGVSSITVRSRDDNRDEPNEDQLNERRDVTIYSSIEILHLSLKKSLAFFAHFAAKFPLIIVFLLMVLYAIPVSATVLALYILVTLLLVIPSFAMLYFAFPSLNWLVRETFT